MALPSARYDTATLHLLWRLTVAQHKLRDQSTLFGFLWSLLNPLLMAGVLFAVFHARLGEAVEHYGLYLLLGMIQYTHFANSTSGSMGVLRGMRELTRETAFPKELLVISSTLVYTADLGLALACALLLGQVRGVTLGWSALLLPGVVVLQFVLVSWVSLLLACAAVFARDVEHIYQALLRVLLFATPIFYTGAFLGGDVAAVLLWLNPLAQLIDLSRGALLEGRVPSAAWLAGLAAAHAVLAGISFGIFKAVEPTLAERV